MAKMFYTLEEAAQKLGVQQDEVMGMVESGQLSEFRDGDDLRFKVEQVDLMSSGDDVDDMIPLVDDADESALGIALEDSGPSGGSGIEIDETVVDLGATQQAKEAVRIADELEAITSVPVFAFLENVASSPREVVQWYSNMFQTRPIQTQPAEFGWVSRTRLWWIRSPQRTLLHTNFALPPDLKLHLPSSDNANFRMQ